jgi:hypothetical protein
MINYFCFVTALFLFQNAINKCFLTEGNFDLSPNLEAGNNIRNMNDNIREIGEHAGSFSADVKPHECVVV